MDDPTTRTGSADPTTAPQARRLRARARARRALWISLAIIATSGAVLVPLSTPNLRRAITLFASPPAATISVTMTGRTIAPIELRVPRGAAVKFEVANLDGPRDGHRFKTTGQAYDIDLAVWGGVTKSDVILTANVPGRYPFLCSIRGHASEGMVGVLVVE